MNTTMRMSGYRDLDLAVEHRQKYGDYDSLVALIRSYESKFASDINLRILARLKADLASSIDNNSWSDVILRPPADLKSASQTIGDVGYTSPYSSGINVDTPISSLPADPIFAGLLYLAPNHTLWHFIMSRLVNGSAIVFRPSAAYGHIIVPVDVEPTIAPTLISGDRTITGVEILLTYDAASDTIQARFTNRDMATCDMALFNLLVDACFVGNASASRVRHGIIAKNSIAANVTENSVKIEGILFKQIKVSEKLRPSRPIARGESFGDLNGFSFRYGILDVDWMVKVKFDWALSSEFFKRVNAWKANPVRFEQTYMHSGHMVNSTSYDAGKGIPNNSMDFFHCDNFTLKVV